jgi:hypothetical protein
VKFKKMNVRTLGAVAAAAMAVCALPAHAAGDDIPPLSLKLSETVSYDTNYGRTTTDRAGEVISSTAVEVGLDKSYGRQRYTGSGKFAIDKHKNIQEQDNQNYDVDLGFASEFASNWSMGLNGAASQNLNPNQNNAVSDRLAKNIRDYSSAGLNVRYGLSGRWAAVASTATSRTSYSLVSSKYQNQQQVSGGLRLIYNTSDLLNFGLGLSALRSESPEQWINGAPEVVSQRSIDFSTNWQVTGFSSLYALLSWSNNRYKSDAAAKINGLTGQLDWDFMPSGLTSYKISLSRSTNNDDSTTGNRFNDVRTQSRDDSAPDGKAYTPYSILYKNLTTSVAASMRWAPTSKIGVNAGVNYYNYKVSRKNTAVWEDPDVFTGIGGIAAPGSTSSNFTVLRLSSDYQYSRAIGVGCSYQHYMQSAESNKKVSYGNPRIAFVGNQYSCNASFKID